MQRLLLLLFSLVFLAACSGSDGHTLTVNARTSLVPGPEFNRVVIDLMTTGSVSERVTEQAEAVAFFGRPFARGVGVATFPNVASGDYTVRATLYRPDGTLLVEQRLRFQLDGNKAVTLYLDRECVDVECPSPGGSAALAACLQGTCVDPRCNPDDVSTREFCPGITFCNTSAECGAVAPCATNVCASGLCIAEPLESGEGACAEGLWCNPVASENACQVVPDSTLPQDAGVADLGVCGTICFIDGNVCETGYWSCDGDAGPVCTGFVFAPAGTSCGEGGVCDGTGTCGNTVDAGAPDMSGPSGIMVTMTPERGLTMVEHDNDGDDTGQFFTVTITRTGGGTTPILISSRTSDTGVCRLVADSNVPTPVALPEELVGEALEFNVQGTNDAVLTGARSCEVTVTVNGFDFTRTVNVLDSDVVEVDFAAHDQLDDKGVTEAGFFGLVLDDTGSRAAMAWVLDDTIATRTTHTVIAVWSRSTSDVELVSMPAGGGIPDDLSFAPSFGPGNWIAYISLASNLVIGDTADTCDVFVEEIGNPSSRRRLALDLDCENEDARLSQTLSFASVAPLLLVTGTVDGRRSAYVYNVETSTFEDQLVDEEGAPLTGFAQSLGISRSGRYVSFLSSVTPDGMVPEENLAFVARDRMTGAVAARVFPLSAFTDGDFIPFFYMRGVPSDADGSFVSDLLTALAVDDTNDSYDVARLTPNWTSGDLDVSLATAAYEPSGAQPHFPGLFADGRVLSRTTNFSTAPQAILTETNLGISRVLGETSLGASTISAFGSVSGNGRFAVFIGVESLEDEDPRILITGAF